MSLNKNIVSGVFWTSIDKFGVQFIQFVLSIIIARILSPEDYGLVGLAAVFIAFSQVFVDSGFGKALVQYNNPNKNDFSTVFYFNFLISCLLYAIIFLLSPYIALFYEMPLLKNLIRLIALTLIIQSFNIVPNAIFSININFRPLAISNSIATIIGGGVGVWAAYSGFGVWALAFMTLTSSLIRTISQWYQSNWFPSLVFSFDSLKNLYRFGGNLLASSLIDVLVRNSSGLFIGKLYSSKDLGFFTKGVDFANTMSNTIISVIFAVLFPSFSKIKNDKEKTLTIFKTSLRYVSLFVFPFFMLFSILAQPLILALLTEKWLITAIVFQYLVLARMINMVALINQQVLHGLGFSYITLKQEILKSIVRFVFILISINFGIVWIAIGELIATAFNFFVNAYPLEKILKFGFIHQLKEIKIIFISSLIATLICYFLINFFEDIYLKLLFSPFVLSLIYLMFLELFKQKDYLLLRNKVINKFF